MVWFEDELGESWITCNTPTNHTKKERHSKTLQVWDCTIEKDLKDLIGTTYTNKIHLFFDSLSHKNFIVKRVWLGIVIRWMTFLKIFKKMVWVKTKYAEKSYVNFLG